MIHFGANDLGERISRDGIRMRPLKKENGKG